MKYYTLDAAFDAIRDHCPSKFGFEHAFMQVTKFFVRDLINCIDNNVPMHTELYYEPVDFLDGNGFKVEGNNTDGYTISLA